MPLLTLETNVSISETSGLVKQLSQTVAETLGKPERYVMVSLRENHNMLFAGSSDPLAYLELKSIGLPEERTTEISALLCTLVSGNLGISSDRIYIEFANAERHMWGWNKATFAR